MFLPFRFYFFTSFRGRVTSCRKNGSSRHSEGDNGQVSKVLRQIERRLTPYSMETIGIPKRSTDTNARKKGINASSCCPVLCTSRENARCWCFYLSSFAVPYEGILLTSRTALLHHLGDFITSQLKKLIAFDFSSSGDL